MLDKLKTLPQYCVPQHAFSRLWGWFANLKHPLWFKNWGIRHFIKKYNVDMEQALIQRPEDYPCFNSFFIRQLKPHLRPVGAGIVSPADGEISESGRMVGGTLIQAKGHNFTLEALVADKKSAAYFENGEFMTIYLAPKDYHRVHMPIAGQLIEKKYIPGRLFSVNQRTANTVPDLFSKNEREVCLFETEIGKMAVILVGAMIVGNIMTKEEISLEKGQEMGYFQLGSTVILLFQENKMTFNTELKRACGIKMGQKIGVEHADQ